eukprot:Hpha_TRINITY_DN15960_c0_g1::TRINITY_DN15960_c0_g1_i1::g.70983::m.70983
MIEATYRSLVPTQKNDRLAIVVQELGLFQSIFSTMNMTSALIGGFAFSAVTNGVDERRGVKIGFFTMAVVCTCCCMHTILASTIASVLSADTAWRGVNPDLNVVKAVQGMVDCRPHVYLPFAFGILMFLGMLALFCIADMGIQDTTSMIGTILVSVICIGTVVASWMSYRWMRRLFGTSDYRWKQTGYSAA